jgi:hypothetical protein
MDPKKDWSAASDFGILQNDEEAIALANNGSLSPLERALEMESAIQEMTRTDADSIEN